MAEQRQYCLTLDLREDEELIREYEEYHEQGRVWPEVVTSIRESGILDMQIYRSGTQLIMVLNVTESFSFEEKARLDGRNPKVVEWEHLMTKFQRASTDARAEGKWRKMRTIFDLKQHKSTGEAGK